MKFLKNMSLGEAKKMYDGLKEYRDTLKVKGACLRDLAVFDGLINDLVTYTNNFNHDYGFTKLSRRKVG